MFWLGDTFYFWNSWEAKAERDILILLTLSISILEEVIIYHSMSCEILYSPV